MLDHTGFVVADLAAAKRFYDAIAKPLGLATIAPDPNFFLLGKGEGQLPYLWIGTLIPSYWPPGAKPGQNTMHFAFIAPDKAAVNAFHKAGLENGGRDNGAPGPREGVERYYGAFLLDPEGNNIEACHRGPDAV